MGLHWYRSWPAVSFPRNRARVIDDLPRLYMRDFDYRTVEDGLPRDEPGFCLLEWDVALAPEGRTLFARQAAKRPNSVLVAPYYTTFNEEDGPVCLHRLRRPGFTKESGHWPGWEPLPEGRAATDLFGFGCIYLPRKVVQEFLATHPGGRPKFNDTSFSLWYLATHGQTLVTWDVHPQHLHDDGAW